MKPPNIQLHCFSNAAPQVYTAVIYLHSEYQNGSVDVKIVASKTRVAPVKQQSIPRLELLGAAILARFPHTILRIFTFFANLVFLLGGFDGNFMMDQE